MNPARPDHWRICLACDQQQPRSRICALCAGSLVKLDEHPKTVAPFLGRARRRLAWLEQPARRDWRNADDGTYYEPERLQRCLRLCRMRIRRMEFVVKLAAAVAAKGTS